MFLSIIIPAYNIEGFIDNCLLSCFSQDLELNVDYEIVVVNDGSKDQTLSRLLSYGNKISLISQENLGVSAARNNGLRYAKGDFVWFIDGDDYIEENCLGGLLALIKQKEIDVLTVGYNKVEERDNFKVNGIPYFISNSKIEDYGDSTELVIWNSIIRRQYLLDHNLWFIEGMKYGEDTLWMSIMELFTQKHMRLNQSVYKYRTRINSVVHIQTPESQRQRFEDMQKMQAEWLKVLNNDKVLPQKQKQIKIRIDWCTSNILLAALKQNRTMREQTMIRLKQDGTYPYRILWSRISFKHGFKNLLTTLFTLFFPFEFYYRIISCCFGKK